jgi:hypothetical protein
VTAYQASPTAPVLFGLFGLWRSLAAVQGVVTTVIEYGFQTLRPPPWPHRPDVDTTAQKPTVVDAYLRSRFCNTPVTTATPGIWLHHPARAWGDHPGGLGDFCTAYGMAGLWLTQSLGWNAKPEGQGGCVVWLPGPKVRSFAFHLDDPWPEPALHLLRTPCLAKPTSGHGRLALQQRCVEEGWPSWMAESLANG